MDRYKQYVLVVIIFVQMILSAGEMQSLSVFKNKFYFLNGFENKLIIYDTSGKIAKEEDLSNIDRDVVTDFFIKYNDIKSYLFSSISNKSYLLDENYNLKFSIDLNKLFGFNFYQKIYPVNYNSILLATEELQRFFILENRELKEILRFSELPTDYFYEREKIFILFADRVEEYSVSGVYTGSIHFKDIEDPAIIFCSDLNVYVKHRKGIDKLNSVDNRKQKKYEYQSRILEETDIQDFAVIGGTVAVLKGNEILFRTVK